MSTQSVCKHCGRPIKSGEYCRRHRNAEPVAEPVSTGEPQPESLSVQKRKHYMAGGHASDFIPIREHDSTVTDGFGSEWPLRCEEDGCDGINQVMRPGSVQCSKEHLHNRAARPSEPSATQTSAEPHEFDPPCKCAIRNSRVKQGGIRPHHDPSCPQYGGVRPENEPQRMARRIAAPQPVSGDAPEPCPTCESENPDYKNNLQCTDPWHKQSGNAPKVEPSCTCNPKPLNGQHWIGCPEGKAEEIAAKFADAMSDHMAYVSQTHKENVLKEVQGIAAAILRPYFPPASQTPSGPLFAPKPNCPDCRGEGWKDRKDEEYCDPCHCLQVAVLGGRRVAGLLPRNTDQAQLQAEVIDLHGKFPKITLSKNMVVGHRPEEGFHVEFICLDREEVIHLAAMLHFYNESFKQPLATPASTARTDGPSELLEVLSAIESVSGDDFCADLDMRNANRKLHGALATAYEKLGQIYRLSHGFNTQNSCHHVHTNWREELKKFAAPGSVPQAPELPKKPHCPNCGCNHLRGENTLCNDGVPQAEPPKKEKP